MKALTIWQPWASLIAIGAKPYEFRGWRAPKSIIGQRIAIHAGARKMRTAEIDDLICRLRSEKGWTTALRPDLALPLLELARQNPDTLPRAQIVCTAILGASVNGLSIVGEFGGKINDSDRDGHANWAWPMDDVRIVMPPVEARGAQGFWNFEGRLDHAEQ